MYSTFAINICNRNLNLGDHPINRYDFSYVLSSFIMSALMEKPARA